MKKFLATVMLCSVMFGFSSCCKHYELIEKPIPMEKYQTKFDLTKNVDITITKGFQVKENVNYEIYNKENILVDKGNFEIENNGNKSEFIVELPIGSYSVYFSNKDLLNKTIIGLPEDSDYFYSIDNIDVVPSDNHFEIELTRIVSEINVVKKKFDKYNLTVSTYHFEEFNLDNIESTNIQTLSKDIKSNKDLLGYIYPNIKQTFRFDITNQNGDVITSKTFTTNIEENKKYTLNIELNSVNGDIKINTSWNGSEELNPEI